MREFTVPPAVTISDTTTLVQAVWSNAEATPAAAQFARRTDTGWEDISFARFRDDVIGVARGLVAAGVQRGDRVALISRTRYEWTLVDYAIWACGAVTVPVYETSSPDQIRWILSDSGAVACVVETAGHAASLAAVRGDLPDLRHIWEIDGGGLADLAAAGADVDPTEIDRRRLGGRADDLATIIYTSGTTGRPKGCVLTHRNIYADIANAIPHMPNLFKPDAATLLFLPLAHSFARLIQVGVVQARVHTAFTADARNLAADLASFKPTFVLAVPRVFEKIFNGARQKAATEGHESIFERATQAAVAYSEALDKGGPGLILRLRHAVFDRLVYRKLRAAIGGRCQAAISGGAPLGPRLAHFFRGVGVTIYEGYGLTETSPAVAVNLKDHIRIGTVGRPLPGVTVRIDEDGEILVKGDLVFGGYWNAPQATAEVLDADGWFHTGDLGALDDDGYLSITGRKKEIIVTAGGKNVAPAVLEDRIRAHPLVSQCMVVGDRQPFVAALVTIDEEALPAWRSANSKPDDARPGDLRDDEDLRREVQSAVDEANRAVSKAESIRVFRILPEDFTEANGMLTPSLKVKRTIVAKEYADEIAAIYR
ncbi:AMP-dependent synthetase/ligase [Luedemannella helvata]|uniref:Acyl-CoA synthetase n=1 Tax=Luedemannella helvata TaxID=349315 RepID=A0ABP4W0R9_9ACTN